MMVSDSSKLQHFFLDHYSSFSPTLALLISCLSLHCRSYILIPYGSFSISNTTAINLINSLRYGKGNDEPEDLPETAAVQLDHYPTQSHRVVLLSQNQRRQSEKSFKSDFLSHKISAQTKTKSSHLLQSPDVMSDGLLNILRSELDCSRMSPEPSVLSGNGSSFLGGYTGTKPLIGEHTCRKTTGVLKFNSYWIRQNILFWFGVEHTILTKS